VSEALEIRRLLELNSEELTGVVRALNGEYILPEAGGDLLRDGAGVLPTGACARGILSDRRVVGWADRRISGSRPGTALRCRAECFVTCGALAGWADGLTDRQPGGWDTCDWVASWTDRQTGAGASLGCVACLGGGRRRNLVGRNRVVSVCLHAVSGALHVRYFWLWHRVARGSV
jgi:CobN/Magnesium Chelatase